MPILLELKKNAKYTKWPMVLGQHLKLYYLRVNMIHDIRYVPIDHNRVKSIWKPVNTKYTIRNIKFGGTVFSGVFDDKGYCVQMFVEHIDAVYFWLYDKRVNS